MRRILAAGLLLAVAAAAGSIGAAPQPDAIEKRGCCSHHKGVCGCKDKVAQCCDGAPSPSCGC